MKLDVKGLDSFTGEELEILETYLGCQDIGDTRDVIDRHQLDLDDRRTEELLYNLYGMISDRCSDLPSEDKVLKKYDLKFEEMLPLLKKGYRAYRDGWNGKGMFIYYVPANSYSAITDVAKEEFGDMVKYNPYFAIKNVNGTVSTWVPSVGDLLAEDWSIK